MKRVFYELAQYVALLLWLPFLAIASSSRWIGRVTQRTGDTLVRPIYWAIVSAKRRSLKMAPWQPHDWQIGIGPPCSRCGRNVPPEKHQDAECSKSDNVLKTNCAICRKIDVVKPVCLSCVAARVEQGQEV